MWAYIILTAMALSTDALGVGISYQLNGVIIPLRTKFVIGAVTAAIMFVTISIGSLFFEKIPDQVSIYFGAVILMIIGVIFIRNSLYQDDKAAYDLDKSRVIEPMEGLLLSVSLSADSIAGGIAMASTGVSCLVLSFVVGAMHMSFLFFAEFLASHIPGVYKLNGKVVGTCSGGLLIFMGISRFFG